MHQIHSKQVWMIETRKRIPADCFSIWLGTYIPLGTVQWPGAIDAEKAIQSRVVPYLLQYQRQQVTVNRSTHYSFCRQYKCLASQYI